MSGWIKFDKDMAHDARLAQAASELLERYLIANRTPGGGSDLSLGDASRFVTHALRGALVTLWCYADEHIRDDDSLPCDVTALDAIIGLDGFCTLMPPYWLSIREDECVVLPGYCQKNGIVSKRKSTSAGAERTRRWREKQRLNGDGSGDASHQPLHGASQPRLRDVTKSVDLDLDLKNKNPSIPSKVERNGGERKGKPSKRHPPKSPIPDGFSLDAEMAAYVTAKIPDANPVAMFEAFCGDARAKGWAYVDWRQAWQTYVRNCAPNSGHWAAGQYPRSGAGATRWM